MAEAREAAYESLLIPTQRLFAADLQAQLVPDFGDPQRLRVIFDYSQVRVLQADENELHQRAREDLKAGLLTLNQAKALIGDDPDPNGDVYYVPTALTVVPQQELGKPMAPPALPPGNPDAADEQAGLRALPEAAGLEGAERKAGDPAEVDDADLVAIRRRWDGVVDEDLRGLLGATMVNGSNGHG
jgi:hypothetical protein